MAKFARLHLRAVTKNGKKTENSFVRPAGAAAGKKNFKKDGKLLLKSFLLSFPSAQPLILASSLFCWRGARGVWRKMRRRGKIVKKMEN